MYAYPGSIFHFHIGACYINMKTFWTQYPTELQTMNIYQTSSFFLVVGPLRWVGGVGWGKNRNKCDH